MLTTPISRDVSASSRRALDPVDRVAECCSTDHGLTFTGR